MEECLNRKHAEHMLEMGQFIMNSYLKAYSEEGKIFDANDVPIIMVKITSRFSKETTDRALKVPEFSGPSTEMESLLSSIKNILEQDLFIAMKKAELDRDKDSQILSPNMIEEKIRKEKRVLARMYLMAEEKTSRAIEYDEIARLEGLEVSEVLHICDRLDTQRLIKIIAPKLARLTDEGITKVREEILGQQKESSMAEAVTIMKQADFSFISDSRIRLIVERDYKELQQLDPHQTPKAVLVLSGAIIEGLLFDAIVENGTWTFDKACERPFKDMIHPAKTAGIISHDNLTDVLRVFRNLVHIAREVKDNLLFNETHAEHARTSVEVIITEVRTWHQKRKATATP
jgi:hypothetical protein